MIRVPLPCLFAWISLLFSSPAAYAWGNRGHQIVAYIAEAHLTESATKKLSNLLPEGQNLAQAAVWPDRIKKIVPQFNPLHTVRVPRGSNYYDPDRDCPERNCIVEAINWYMTVLKSKESPLAEKQFALDYIVHLTGDLHQPLHVGFTDDHSGSLIKVFFDGKEQTLHQLWDSSLLARKKGSAKALAEQLDREFTAEEERSWQSGRPGEWANESLALTIRYVYPLPESRQIGEDYVKQAMPVIDKRLAQAGLRLASLLNDALK